MEQSQAAPVGWTDVYLDASYADIAEEVPSYAGLVYSLLEERHDVLIHENRQTVRAAPVSAELAEVLQVVPGDHALEMRRSYFDRVGEAQIISLSILSAQNYSYEITLRRQAAAS